MKTEEANKKPQRTLSNTLGEISIPRGCFSTVLCVLQGFKERDKDLKTQLIEGTEGEAIPKTFLSLLFKKFSVDSVVRY
jgi:hypothetical protein